MFHHFFNFTDAPLRGAGGYGIVLEQSKKAIKLLYDSNACENLRSEASIQQEVYTLLQKFVPEVRVPEIYSVYTQPVNYKDTQYLCGIEMENLLPPEGFDEQVHMLLGYHGDDIDEEWGKNIGPPVSELNPTRGFFASPETLEMIWADEQSKMTIEKLSFLMGKVYKTLLLHKILPIDLEWVWSNGYPYIIDFGLCERGGVEPSSFLEKRGVRGLADEFYVPHKGDRGYDEFMKGFSFTT